MKLRPRILAECHRDARWQRDALSLARVHVLRRLAEVLEGSYLGEEGEGRWKTGGGGSGGPIKSRIRFDGFFFEGQLTPQIKNNINVLLDTDVLLSLSCSLSLVSQYNHRL